MPIKINPAPINILGVNGSFRKINESNIVNTMLPLSIALT